MQPEPDTPVRTRTKVLRIVQTVAGWLWFNVLVGIFGLWVVGRTLRDIHPVTAMCMAIPSVLASLSLAATAFLAWLMRCRRVALAALVCAVFPTVSVLYVENQWRRPAPRGDVARSLRVVHWNVGETGGRADLILEHLKPLEADVYVLAELFGPNVQSTIVRGLGPGYRVLKEEYYLNVFARGRVYLRHLEKRISKRAYFVEWESPAGPLLFLLIDLKSRPPFYRGPILDTIRERMVEMQPDIVVGDFNTSRSARMLSHLPEGYAHAYDAAGAGWCYTWHDRCPVWDINQCIFGPRVEPIRYDVVATGVSDHLLQVFDFSLSQTKAE